MTRENKLALIVGFGLILFVGVLLSDHFSAARNSEPGPLKPLSQNGTRSNDPQREPIDLRPMRPDSEKSAASTNDEERPIALLAGDNRQSIPDIIHLPDLQQIPQDRPMVGNNAGAPTTVQATSTHRVVAGESLERICRHHYGNISLLDELAAFNKLANPDFIREGMRLRLPDASVLGGVGGGLAAGAGGVASSELTEARDHSSPSAATYTVKPNETLSEIAQRLLQSSRQWRRIYDLNRDVISNPDHVRAGVVLRIPQN